MNPLHLTLVDRWELNYLEKSVLLLGSKYGWGPNGPYPHQAKYQWDPRKKSIFSLPIAPPF